MRRLLLTVALLLGAGVAQADDNGLFYSAGNSNNGNQPKGSPGLTAVRNSVRS